MGKAKSIAAAICTVGLAALPSGVVAGGFALYEQSVKGLGNAFAGSAAVAEDAATLCAWDLGLHSRRAKQGRLRPRPVFEWRSHEPLALASRR